MEEIENQEPSIGAVVSKLPWVNDGITWGEVQVLITLLNLTYDDPALARQIVSTDFRSHLLEPGLESISQAAGYEWVADGLDPYEMQALIVIVRIDKQNPELSSRVLGFSWLADGVSYAEAHALDGMSSLIPDRTEILGRILEYDWLADELIRSEAAALNDLASLSSLDWEFATQALDYEWVVDGITWNEHLVLEKLSFASSTTRYYLLDISSRLPELVTVFDWIADGLNAYEMRALIGMAEISQLVPDIYNRLAEYSWTVDGISKRESDAINDLRDLTTNVEITQQILDLGLLDDPVRDSDLYALKSFRQLAFTPDRLVILTNQSWFADGLDEEEIAFVAMVDSISTYSTDTEYRSLLQDWSTQHTTLSLPLVGEVRVWVFLHGAFHGFDSTLGQIEEVLRASESLMGTPFPTKDIILWLPDPGILSGGFHGFHTGEGMALATVIADRWTIYHETAHYYDVGLSRWFTEGLAEFVAAYTIDHVGLEDIETTKSSLKYDLQWCAAQGFEKIQDLVDYFGQLWNPDEYDFCNYILGHNFLISVFQLLGEEVMSAALNELYLQPEIKRHDLTEEDFYLTFLRHTPSELQDDFRVLYKRLHGGLQADKKD